MGRLSDRYLTESTDLFGDHARARNSDPDTSHIAARKVTPKLRSLQAFVLEEFRKAGPAGMTDLDLEIRHGSPISTLRTRRSELVEKGLIVDTGRKRMQRGSNRIIWAIKP